MPQAATRSTVPVSARHPSRNVGLSFFTKEATSRIGVGNLYRLMRGYAEGGYVGGAGSPAQMRRAEGINFNQNNHVVIQNDGPNGRAGPQLMKAVYEMARKGAQDELRLQLRDGGMLSGSGG